MLRPLHLKPILFYNEIKKPIFECIHSKIGFSKCYFNFYFSFFTRVAVASNMPKSDPLRLS
jgi:hypothetical protein